MSVNCIELRVGSRVVRKTRGTHREAQLLAACARLDYGPAARVYYKGRRIQPREDDLAQLSD